METTSNYVPTGSKGSSRDQEKAQRILRQFMQEMGTRGVWESHWQEIAERIWPGMSWKFNPYWSSTPGQKKTQHLFDSTATISLSRFAAILDSLLTPRSSIWHTMTAIDPALMRRTDVRNYYEDVNRILFHYRYLGQANFESQNHFSYKALGGFGNGCLFIDALKGRNAKGLRYKGLSLGETYWAENHQGIIDKLYRYFELTARQALQVKDWQGKPWKDKLPESILKAAVDAPETIFHFIHIVEPRDESEYDPKRKDVRGMPFDSSYVCKEDTTLLEEGGFNVFPYAPSRYDVFPGEKYGRSPAMDLLPAIKTLNEEKKTLLKQGQRISDPVLLTHDDGVVDGLSLRPGAVNPGGVTSDGKSLVHVLPTGNVQITKEMMDDERETIKDGFLVSIFQILQENPQMTATEVLERAKEKGILLTPTVGRQQSERDTPMIERELDVLAQQGLLPKMPLVLQQAKAEYKAVFDSPLNRAQRAEEGAGIVRTIQTTLEIVNATQDPSPLDNFNIDQITIDLAAINAVPHRWMSTDEEKAQKRAQRAQANQQKSMMDGAGGTAALLNAATKAHQGG